jgi:hypothetical protein
LAFGTGEGLGTGTGLPTSVCSGVTGSGGRGGALTPQLNKKKMQKRKQQIPIRNDIFVIF